MTAELCDCFPTKTVGVNTVLDAVVAGIPGRSIVVWGVDGKFHSMAEVRRQPQLSAAANWLALAILAARSIPDSRGLLIDIGSTTTDLIPLDRGRVAARGKSDTERLQTGELVYAGSAERQPARWRLSYPFRGVATGLAAEIFASGLDVYLMLGEVASNASDLSITDGPVRGNGRGGPRPPRQDGRHRPRRILGRRRNCVRPGRRRMPARIAWALAAQHATRPTIGQPVAAVGKTGSGEFLGASTGPARRRIGRHDHQPARILGTDRIICRLRVRSGQTCFGKTPQRRSSPVRLPNRPDHGRRTRVTTSSLAILKVGGSLFRWPEFPRRFAEMIEARRVVNCGERLVLIAGGGPAADVIRDLDKIHGLGDPEAHRLSAPQYGPDRRHSGGALARYRSCSKSRCPECGVVGGSDPSARPPGSCGNGAIGRGRFTRELGRDVGHNRRAGGRAHGGRSPDIAQEPHHCHPEANRLEAAFGWVWSISMLPIVARPATRSR